MTSKGMSQRLCTVLFVVSAICSLATGAAYGLDNPTDGFMPIEYKNNNGEYITTARREFTACYYNVIYNGWCGVGCYTATNQKYNHYHFSDGFPFQDTREGRNEEVTQGKVEAYYTEKVYSPVNWTKIEDPSCVTNCHGYAFDTGNAIQSVSAGSSRFLKNGFTVCSSVAQIQYATIDTPDIGKDFVVHSVAIVPVQVGQGWGIGVRREKSNAGPVYERTYSPGLIVDNWDEELWRPN